MNRIFTILVSLFFLFHFCNCYAQNGVVTGRITDASTDEVLMGVTVGTGSSGTMTNDAGLYSLSLASGIQTLKFSFIGYTAIEKQITIKPEDTIYLNIELNSTAQQLGTVVVSGSRFEKKISEEIVSMQVIKPSFIENTNSISMDEAVNRTPGVNIIDGQANIRGGSGYSYGAGSRVLVLVDDVPQLAADAGDVKWEFLPVENLDQVEIIKGASSTLYGSSALNGVINVRTAYPTSVPKTQINFYQGVYQNPQRQELVWWGNHQPYYTGGYFNHSQKFGQLDFVTGGNIFNESSFRQGEYTERGRFNINTRYRFRHVDGLSMGLNMNSLLAHTGAFFVWMNDSLGYQPFGGMDSATTSIVENNYTRFNLDPFITYYNKNGNRHAFHGRYYQTKTQSTGERSTNAQLFYGEYQFQKFFKFGLNITTGAVATYSKIDAALYGIHDANNEAIFLQLDQKIGNLSVVGGVRYEMFRLDTMHENSKPVFRAGANYKISKATYLRASYGQGFRYPSIAEKFVKTAIGSLYVYPNPDVTGETGWSAEFGINQGFKISKWLGYIDLAAFTNRYHDFIEFSFGQWGKPSDPFLGIGFKSINLEDAIINGGEAVVMGTGKIGKVNINLVMGYTYIMPVDVNETHYQDSIISVHPELTSEQIDSMHMLGILKYRYQHNAKFDLDVSYKNFSTGVDVRYNSFMVNIDQIFNVEAILPGVKSYRQEHHTGDYIIDYRISMQINKYTKLSLITKNLLNREYTERPALIEMPRNFSLQVAVKF
ncbi:MAG TPA: hypothetical protein DCQ93_03820 [Bacteroidetes bacterium]|nr:hypothetical protein [Bacteroidota bacterium]